ncbi:MAG: histidine kinase [Burkholderiaceae bacterium]|nr:histidine kinase [Microbacteriaceae bacterium]
MEHFAKERDRLLFSSARAAGIAASAVSALCLVIPGVVPVGQLVAIVLPLALLVVALVRMGSTGSFAWAGAGIAAGIAVLVLVQLPLGQGTSTAASTAVVPIAGGAVASFAIVLVGSPRRILLLVLASTACVFLTELAVPGPNRLSSQAAMVVLGWALATTFALWLRRTAPQAAKQIFRIGRAHRTERQASETEAQRRQGARLLHDTVLATLTLLAHSGVGVSPSALRHQAGDDARLLRQLRLGGAPVPQSSSHYNLEPVEETALGTTLLSVKQRFGRMGLEVSWHGTGQVLLPSDVLDAFLLALAECLENVRRHAGVAEAHVTITDDATTVRAMVTDSGVGFKLDEVDPGRLGFSESVVGRLRQVGGNARLFSSPGAGTTVVLEVPK